MDGLGLSRLALLALATVAACGRVLSIQDAAQPPADGTVGAGPDGASEDAAGPDGPVDASGERDVAVDAWVSGLVLWLNGDVGLEQDAGAITLWVDQSPMGNDALPTTTTGQSGLYAEPPRYVEASVGGHPGLAFEPGDAAESALWISDSPSLRFGMDDFVLAIVARVALQTGWYACLYQGGYDSGSPAGPRLYAWAPSQMDSGLEAQFATTAVRAGGVYSDDVARIYAMRRTGSVVELRVNGQVVSSRGGENGTLNAMSDVFIARGQGCVSFRGQIAEVIADRGPGVSVNTSVIEAYLKAKYGL